MKRHWDLTFIQEAVPYLTEIANSDWPLDFSSEAKSTVDKWVKWLCKSLNSDKDNLRKARASMTRIQNSILKSKQNKVLFDELVQILHGLYQHAFYNVWIVIDPENEDIWKFRVTTNGIFTMAVKELHEEAA